MFVHLRCAPADVSADALGLLIDGPLPDVLAEHTVAAGAARLHLGIIGASHVASVFADDVLVFREEMSCNVPGPLPPALTRDGYSFSRRVERCSLAEIAGHVEDLDDSWLVARFPGAGPYHVTGVSGWLGPDGAWFWRTLHCYPEQQTVVTTLSRYEL